MLKIGKFSKKISIWRTLPHLKIRHPIHTRKFHQLTSTLVVIRNSQILTTVTFLHWPIFDSFCHHQSDIWYRKYYWCSNQWDTVLNTSTTLKKSEVDSKFFPEAVYTSEGSTIQSMDEVYIGVKYIVFSEFFDHYIRRVTQLTKPWKHFLLLINYWQQLFIFPNLFAEKFWK